MAAEPQCEAQHIHPYVIYAGWLNRDNCPPEGIAFPPRTTRWYELELIVWGQGRIDTMGIHSETFRGRLFFRRPGMRVQGFAPYHSYFILFDLIRDPNKQKLYEADEMGQLYGVEGMGTAGAAAAAVEAFPGIVDTVDSDVWERLCDGLYREFARSGREDQLFLKTGVLQLLLQLRQETLSRHAPSPSPHHAAIRAVQAAIDGNPAERFTLPELARRAGMSRSLFGSHFTAVVGESPITYVNRARIRLAKQYLLRSDGSAKEIAYLCGFENVNYFFRTFKRLTGMTPLKYRERAF
jgi:AraC-like DNA-binding protein